MHIQSISDAAGTFNAPELINTKIQSDDTCAVGARSAPTWPPEARGHPYCAWLGTHFARAGTQNDLP